MITVNSKILKIKVAYGTYGKCQRIPEERDASVVTGEKECSELDEIVSVT